MNAKTFQKLVTQQQAAGCVEERLTYGGSFDITPARAIEGDWLFALAEAHADLAQECRHFSNPDTGDQARKAAVRHLAQIVALAEAMAKHVPKL